MSPWWPAALASSQVVWILCTKYAGPTNDPVLFTTAMLGGTTLSLLLCYLIPYKIGRDISSGCFQLPRWAEWIVRSVALFGAASSVFWISTWAPWWLWLGGLTILALRNFGPLVLSLFSFGLMATVFYHQWPGLWIRNAYLASEAGLGDELSLFLGIALAGVPGSLYAYRQARTSDEPWRPAIRRGVLTHALPIIVTVTISGLNLVTSVRMFWKPSIVFGPEYSLGWIGITMGFKTLLAAWTLLALAPLCAWAHWAQAAIGPLKKLTPASIVLFTGTIGVAWIRVHNEPLFLQGYDTAWGWSLLAVSLIYGFSRVVRDFVTRSAISRN